MLPRDVEKGGESPIPVFSRKIKRLAAQRSKIFGSTKGSKEMLKMKVGPEMCMKTKGSMTKCPSRRRTFGH
jgi:hypothetical protein